MRCETSPRQAGPALNEEFPLFVVAGDSAWESQKVQARTPDGSIEPHCKHVVVTGAFCAADASTPVGVNRKENTTTKLARGEKLRELGVVLREERIRQN